MNANTKKTRSNSSFFDGKSFGLYEKKMEWLIFTFFFSERLDARKENGSFAKVED